MTEDDDDSVLEEIQRARAAAAELVLSSAHRLRVVIAGPGTGKSFVFREALGRAGGQGLALTFIRKLAAELAVALGDRAETYTFHKFAKILVYRLNVPGLTADFSLYPPLGALTNIDLGLVATPPSDDRMVERQMQELEAGGTLPVALQLGTYYDAASFVDVVYRVFQFLEANPERTPAYPLVVVDEYQDFTRLETAFIAQLGFKSPLLIAGDDDQALYDFRFATAEHIRALAESDFAERHTLPFCSRCPQPVVDAVNSVIDRATAAGYLVGRLDKPFSCYLPDKIAASRRYPKLLEARCTVKSVMARYIENEIDKIPAEDVEASSRGGHPTAMIIGPSYLVEPVYEQLSNGKYPQTSFPRSSQIAAEPIDGYRRLARDPRSNLGWRILVHLLPFDGWELSVTEAITMDDPLVEQIPVQYRDMHLAIAGLVERGLSRDTLTGDERALLAGALGVTEGALDETLGLPEDPDEDPGNAPFGALGPAADSSEEKPPATKTVLCTTLPGAKGLSAEHVFIVGVVGGHLPRENGAPTDKEICDFLVALSRTRTACHLVSINQYGPPPRGRRVPPRLPRSVFAQWVGPHAETFDVRASDLTARTLAAQRRREPAVGRLKMSPRRRS